MSETAFHRGRILGAASLIGLLVVLAATLAASPASSQDARMAPAALFLPLRGDSLMSTEWQPFHDAAVDDALSVALREHLDLSRVELHELDADVNDPAFALAMANRLHELRAAWIPA